MTADAGADGGGGCGRGGSKSAMTAVEAKIVAMKVGRTRRMADLLGANHSIDMLSTRCSQAP
jgi:hypothetical protein